MRIASMLAVTTFVAMAEAPPMAIAQEAQSQCPAINASTPQPVASRRGRAQSSVELLAAANGAARQRPDRESFAQARQIYTYAPGAIYELYANPNFISAILLEPGETLNDVAAGDTARWMVTEAQAEAEVDGRTIVLVKPQAANLRTNIVLVTSRRTYTIEAVAQSGQTYSTEIAWCYPERAAPSANVNDLNFSYRIRTTRGSRPVWLPTRVFDDGRRTWIEMPQQASSTDLPPLFVITGEGVELVNYRLQGDRYMVDRVFDIAELRLGTRSPIIVRLERERNEAPPARRIGRP